MIAKGKWTVYQEDNHFAIRSSEDLCPIAETRHGTDIDKANAQLIASAPALYEALRALVYEWDKARYDLKQLHVDLQDESEDWVQAKEALAKARK